jgi:hypothetical protein
MDRDEYDRLSIKRDGLLTKKRLLDAIQKLLEIAPTGANSLQTNCNYLCNAVNIYDWQRFASLIEAIKVEGAVDYEISESIGGDPWGENAVNIEITEKFQEIHKRIGKEYHNINDIIVKNIPERPAKKLNVEKLNPLITQNVYNKSQVHYGAGSNVENYEKINTTIKNNKKWYEKPLGIILLAVVAGVIILGISVYLGWN